MVKPGVFLNGENVSTGFNPATKDHLQEQDWLAEMNALRESASNLGQYPDDAKFHGPSSRLVCSKFSNPSSARI